MMVSKYVEVNINMVDWENITYILRIKLNDLIKTGINDNK